MKSARTVSNWLATGCWLAACTPEQTVPEGSGGAPGDAAAGGSATGGSPGRGGSTGTGGSGISGSAPKIPQPTEPCPTIATGNITVAGTTVQIWAGTKQATQQGPVFFYWHGTGETSGSAQYRMKTQIAEITAAGGVVASFNETTKTGKNTCNNVWYTGDFAMADQILACAVQQLNIDTRRVYTGGCSAGDPERVDLQGRRAS
jgi:hypothetical protein